MMIEIGPNLHDVLIVAVPACVGVAALFVVASILRKPAPSGDDREVFEKALGLLVDRNDEFATALDLLRHTTVRLDELVCTVAGTAREIGATKPDGGVSSGGGSGA